MAHARGLYAVYDRASLAGDALDRVEAVLAAGACWLQYRDKRTQAPDTALLADLCTLARAYSARLIVNDDWRAAAGSDADGVHLGQDDASIAQARAALGSRALIGISCSGSYERARAGIAAGADYVSFGRFFASPTKPHAAPAELSVLHQARALNVPVVAIGGINCHNAPQLIAAGADLVAASSALFHADDSGAAARRLVALFEQQSSGVSE